MSLANTGVLVGVAVALPLAWRLGGLVGVGIATGFLLGAALVMAGAAYQARCMRVRPERVMTAHMTFSLVKLTGLVLSWLALDGLPFVAKHFRDVVDWRAFLIAYATAALVGTLLAALDVARSLKSSANSSTPTGWSNA